MSSVVERKSALEDRGLMQGPTLRKPAAHLQLSNRGNRLSRSRPAIHLAIQCGRDSMHWLKSTIAASFGMISVEAAS